MKTNFKTSAKVITLVVIALFSGSLLYAQLDQGGQQGPPPIPNANQVTEMITNLAKDLSLTDAQKTTISKLYTVHFDQLRKLTSGNQKPKREEMEALKTNFEKQIKAELTHEQLLKFEASHDKRRAK